MTIMSTNLPIGHEERVPKHKTDSERLPRIQTSGGLPPVPISFLPKFREHRPRNLSIQVTMSKPTIVMVPGAWHKPIIYSDVASHLHKHGYPTVLLPLPSAGAVPPHEDFAEDVTAIRDCLTSLINEGKDIVLAVHSYTGMPGSEACKGLGKKERQTRGEKGGVIRFVCINAFAMPIGFQPTLRGEYSQFPAWMKINTSDDITTVTPSDAASIFYHDLPSSECSSTREKWVKELEPHQSLGMKDKSVFTLEAVEGMLGAARGQVESAFDVVERCEEGGHCLMVSYPEWTAQALRRAAGEKV
ncbi:uncharacterized protein LY89DRAFT_720029 [Mollisia scopiformis]|uniref:AB hydrolase-1 domain-containing protein n=1 Tax=Mollisia scopiformis TaxID=149040 RepID=A0A194X5N5_MOLSC|nr:uncharacterized protein LY89DRAFT_720029 [Mollisia scopiformis]KUJ15495.1 hypothetical protein LY89DRAFT_720029 [Mollisia scopiformis]